MDRGAWWAAVHKVSNSRTQLKQLSMQAVRSQAGTVLSTLPTVADSIVHDALVLITPLYRGGNQDPSR